MSNGRTVEGSGCGVSLFHLVLVSLLVQCGCSSHRAYEAADLEKEPTLEARDYYKKCESIRLGKLDYDKISLSDFVRVLERRSKANDRSGNGVSIVLLGALRTKGDDFRITIHAKPGSLLEAIRLTALACGGVYRIEASRVVFTPRPHCM